MRDEALQARWDVLLDARSAVNAKLEVLREKKVIGSSLQASVVLDVNDAVGRRVAQALRRLAADALHRVDGHARPPRGERRAGADRSAAAAPADGSAREWTIDAAPAQGEKCPRCWRIVPAVSSASDSAGLCERCVDAMAAGRVAG